MKLRKVLAVCCSLCFSLGAVKAAFLQINSLNTPITEDFDTLASSGTANTTMPNGWAFSETGTSGNTTYAAGNGSGNGGNTYSFGATSASERALGSLLSGTVIPAFGVAINNNSGSAFSSLGIRYTGEQWRIGVTSRGAADRLDFQYSTDASSLTTGSWFDFDSLDFSSPITSGTAGALNGNDAANRVTLLGTLGVTIPQGGTIWLRWSDYDISPGADDGLAIDDFSITAMAVPEPSTWLAGALLALPFGVQGIRYLRNRKRA